MSLKSRHKIKWEKIFCTRLLAFAAAVCMAMLLVHFFVRPSGNFQLFDQSATCKKPVEVVRTSDNCAIENDSNSNILCIQPDGTVRYQIPMPEEHNISGITLDSSDNLYAYVSRFSQRDGQLQSGEIRQYNPKGRFVKTLYTFDYTQAANAVGVTPRTSPLHYKNGRLYFVHYRAGYSDLYQINLSTNKTTKLGTLASTVPFLYTDIVSSINGHYLYAKQNGEIGEGEISSDEVRLCKAKYDLHSGKGVRPFSVRSSHGLVYVYDYWAGKIFCIQAGHLVQPKVTLAAGDIAQVHWNTDVNYFSACNEVIYGISGKTPWYTQPDAAGNMASTVYPLPTSGKLDIWTAFTGNLQCFVCAAALPVLAAAGLFLLIGLMWRIFIRGRKVFWKLAFSFLCMTVLLLVGLGLLLQVQQKLYVQQISTYQKRNTDTVAQMIDAYAIERFADTTFVDSNEYQEISRQIIQSASVYQSDSDTAMLLLTPSTDSRVYQILASNRGLNDTWGNDTTCDTLIRQTKGSKTPVSLVQGSLLMSCAPLLNRSNNIVGYLVEYTTLKSIAVQFFQMWSVPVLLVAGGVIVVLAFLLPQGVSQSAKKMSESIRKIADGNFSERVHWLPADEVGDVGRSVNILADNIQLLLDKNLESYREIQKSQEEVLISLASITEVKSGQTASHVRRVSEYVKILCKDFGYSEKEIEYISTASMLHDVGKLFVPHEILEKPGKLTPEEYEIIKHHTRDGAELLRNAPGPIMQYARVIAMYHHEKWNGKGYEGLQGVTIPLVARITALADVFDALTSRRSYKDAYPFEKARNIILAERGEHFDPQIVDAFKKHYQEFMAVVSDLPEDTSPQSNQVTAAETQIAIMADIPSHS